jgi:hypothetical protein
MKPASALQCFPPLQIIGDSKEEVITSADEWAALAGCTLAG